MVQIFDVGVVGGGPAGSTTARECAQLGLSVVLLDKAQFPRDKPCGGGVTLRCASLLPFDLSPVTEREITGVEFTTRPMTAIPRSDPNVLTYLTQRRHLDTFLLGKAEKSGVKVMQRAPVNDVARSGSDFVLKTKAESIHCRYVVGADGANGITARATSLSAPRWMGIALEGNLDADPVPARWQDTIGIDFGHISRGYGWIFPKGTHVNVGLGGWQGSGPSLRRRLDRLVRWYGFDPKRLWNLRGHPLPVRLPGAAVASGNVLLVGDAAGFLDPFTGEGIFGAIWSGRAAAQRIAEAIGGTGVDACARYAEDVRNELLPDLRVSRKLADLFHIAPWIWTQGIRSERIWRLACRLLTGEETYSGASGAAGWASSGLSLVYEGLKLVARTSGETRRGPLLFAA